MNDYFDLSGKTALVVGASSGIGERFAQVLSSQGASVILASRNVKKLDNLAKALPKSQVYSMDVSSSESVQTVFSEMNKNKQVIDICVITSGIAKLTPVFTNNDDDFADIFNTNVLGTWYVAKACAQHMRKYKTAGSIITVSSVNGANKIREEITGYAASKAGVIQMTKAMVGELSPYNIRINCIAPGLVHTELTNYKLNTKEMQDEMIKKIPLGFVAKPNELDGALLYLASNGASRYVTGTCITVDGGASWGGAGK